MKRFNFTVLPIVANVLLLMCTMILFVPLMPKFPEVGLDNSWAYALNSGFASGLVYGQDIVFTFGPYASLVTGLFHPDVDIYTIWSSVIFSISFYFALIMITNRTTVWFAICMLVFCIGAVYFLDPVIYLYFLLVGIFFYKLIVDKSIRLPLNEFWYAHLLSILLLSTFGLLALVKGSFLIVAIIVSLMNAVFLLYHKYRVFAFYVMLVPPVSMILYWLAVGQPLGALIDYLRNSYSIIQGYSQAMSINGKTSEIFGYIIASAVIVTYVVFIKKSRWWNTLYLVGVYLLVLFIVFKGGFVRHDAHAVMAGAGVFLVSTTLIYVKPSFVLVPICFSCAVIWAGINNHYFSTTVAVFVDRLEERFTEAVKGAYLRLNSGNSLKERYHNARSKIVEKYRLPELKGTVDIYSYGQSYLLAADYKWRPRPVFQSYSVYTAKLANINRKHLQSEEAPDNIIFRIEPIDYRLPSLEDGASWPVLLTRYWPKSYDGEYILLSRKSTELKPMSTENPVTLKGKVNEWVAIGNDNQARFARIFLRPSLLGHAMSILYKTDGISIELKTIKGDIVSRRYIPGMGEAEFLISPQVSDTREFLLLYLNDNYLKQKAIQAFRIVPDKGTERYWQDEFSALLRSTNITTEDEVMDWFDLDQPIRFYKENFLDAKMLECHGRIERVNGLLADKGRSQVSGQLLVQGWVSVDPTKGVSAKEVWIGLEDSQGEMLIYSTRKVLRPDVAQYFNKKELAHAGYEMFADAANKKGNYSVTVFINDGVNLVQCTNLTLDIIFKD